MTEKQTQSVLCFRGDKAALHAVLTPEEGKQVLIPVEFVERSLVEHTGCGYIHFIPYAMFYAYDADRGALAVAAYNRPGGMNGEEQLEGKASFGFGGHIDQINLILQHTPEEFITTTEDGRTVYMVPPELLDMVCRETLVKELVEELGEGAMATLTEEDIATVQPAIMEVQDRDDVGLRHVPMLYNFSLPLQRLMALMSAATPDEREVIKLRLVSIRLSDLVMSFNVSNETAALYKELYEGEMQVEQWSVSAVSYVIETVVAGLRATLNLTDLLNLSAQRRHEALEAERQAQEVQADAVTEAGSGDAGESEAAETVEVSSEGANDNTAG